jgi:hypothetical protein
MAAAEEQQDGQKTLVAFIVGLLIGGMLVWAFSGPDATAPEVSDVDSEETAESTQDDKVDTTTPKPEGESTPAPTLEVGDGSVVVEDQRAGTAVTLKSAVYPVSEGWIGVREYTGDQLGYILGVVRFSESQGLVPSEIVLQRATTPGNRYAIVIFTEDGDFDFGLAGDVQIDEIFDTFVAQ